MKIRTFVSIAVPNTAGLSPLMRDLKEIRGVKTQSVSQLHITLRFLGDVDEERIDEIEKIVNESLVGVKKGRLNLKGVGAFPSERNPRILWVGIDTEIGLADIADRISVKLKAAGIGFDDKPFKPHVTVGRIEGRPNLTHLIGKYRTTEFTTYIVPSVFVMKSELTPSGAVHSILRVCELHRMRVQRTDRCIFSSVRKQSGLQVTFPRGTGYRLTSYFLIFSRQSPCSRQNRRIRRPLCLMLLPTYRRNLQR